MERCNKFPICETCADVPAGIEALTVNDTKHLIETQIGPELANKEGLDAKTGKDSFIRQLTISGDALQEKAHRLLGLTCFRPRYWRT